VVFLQTRHLLTLPSAFIFTLLSVHQRSPGERRSSFLLRLLALFFNFFFFKKGLHSKENMLTAPMFFTALELFSTFGSAASIQYNSDIDHVIEPRDENACVLTNFTQAKVPDFDQEVWYEQQSFRWDSPPKERVQTELKAAANVGKRALDKLKSAKQSDYACDEQINDKYTAWHKVSELNTYAVDFILNNKFRLPKRDHNYITIGYGYPKLEVDTPVKKRLFYGIFENHFDLSGGVLITSVNIRGKKYDGQREGHAKVKPTKSGYVIAPDRTPQMWAQGIRDYIRMSKGHSPWKHLNTIIVVQDIANVPLASGIVEPDGPPPSKMFPDGDGDNDTPRETFRPGSDKFNALCGFGSTGTYDDPSDQNKSNFTEGHLLVPKFLAGARDLVGHKDVKKIDVQLVRGNYVIMYTLEDVE
jgi:hypothetical protein